MTPLQPKDIGMARSSPVGGRILDLYAVLAIGGALALIAGVFETGYRYAGYPLSPRLRDVGQAFWWILPAGMLLLCAPVMAAVALVRGLRPAWMPTSRAVFWMAVLPFLSLSVVLLLSRVHDVVHVLLALGLANVVSRRAATRPERTERVARWLFPVLLAVPLMTRAHLQYTLTVQERATIAGLPTAPPQARNVLFLVWDTVRETDLSLYGYDRETTPHLTARAAGGVVFDRAYSTAPWTLPSHGSMFTGRIMQELNANWTTPLDNRHPVVAEVFAGLGYRTGGFTANRMAAMASSGLGRGFHRYEDWRLSRYARDLVSHLVVVEQLLRRVPPLRGLRVLDRGYKDAIVVTDDFLRWLDRYDPSTPFFAFLNYFNAHEVYHASQEHYERFPGDAPRDRYDAAIAYQDDELERLLRELETRGLLENTVVVLTSDHGEAFGDHDSFGHGGTVYVEQLHVPLVVLAPGRAPAGVRIAAPVSLRDLATTVLDLALDPAPSHSLGGRSLSRFWSGVPGSPDTVLAGVHQGVNVEEGTQIERGNALAVVLGPWHYLLDGDGRELIFDVVADSFETRNLAGEDSLQPLLRSLRGYLRGRLDSAWTRHLPAGAAP